MKAVSKRTILGVAIASLSMASLAAPDPAAYTRSVKVDSVPTVSVPLVPDAAGPDAAEQFNQTVNAIEASRQRETQLRGAIEFCRRDAAAAGHSQADRLTCQVDALKELASNYEHLHRLFGRLAQMADGVATAWQVPIKLASASAFERELAELDEEERSLLTKGVEILRRYDSDTPIGDFEIADYEGLSFAFVDWEGIQAERAAIEESREVAQINAEVAGSEAIAWRRSAANYRIAERRAQNLQNRTNRTFGRIDMNASTMAGIPGDIDLPDSRMLWADGASALPTVRPAVIEPSAASGEGAAPPSALASFLERLRALMDQD